VNSISSSLLLLVVGRVWQPLSPQPELVTTWIINIPARMPKSGSLVRQASKATQMDNPNRTIRPSERLLLIQLITSCIMFFDFALEIVLRQEVTCPESAPSAEFAFSSFDGLFLREVNARPIITAPYIVEDHGLEVIGQVPEEQPTK
jgi:hypothetical protein